MHANIYNDRHRDNCRVVSVELVTEVSHSVTQSAVTNRPDGNYGRRRRSDFRRLRLLIVTQ